jgi:hypothetical protein
VNIAASVYTNSRDRLAIVAEHNILPSTTNSRSKRIGIKGTLTNPQEKKKTNGNPAANKTYLIWYERKSGMLMTMVKTARSMELLISISIITTHRLNPDHDSMYRSRSRMYTPYKNRERTSFDTDPKILLSTHEHSWPTDCLRGSARSCNETYHHNV